MEKNYGTHVANLVCASCALEIIIDALERDERNGEVYILEKVRESIEAGVDALDKLTYLDRAQF